MRISRHAVALAMAGAFVCRPAAAQDRPFLFSVSTPRTEIRHVTVHVDAGVGERPFDMVEGDRPEQRIGLQASLGNGLTFLARVGIAADERDMRTSQQGEMLYS